MRTDHLLIEIEVASEGEKRARCVCGWTGDWTDEGDYIAEHAAHAHQTP